MNYNDISEKERESICDGLIGLLEGIQTFKGLANSTHNDNSNAAIPEETTAEVGDIVEVVVNPETPEEEIVSGELLGVLDEDEEIAEDSTEQTILVRTKNGRVRRTKISRTIKVTNSRKQNRLVVKTSNKAIKNKSFKDTKNSGGLDAMRTGDTYAPLVKEGLVITKNTQNEEMPNFFDIVDTYYQRGLSYLSKVKVSNLPFEPSEKKEAAAFFAHIERMLNGAIRAIDAEDEKVFKKFYNRSVVREMLDDLDHWVIQLDNVTPESKDVQALGNVWACIREAAIAGYIPVNNSRTQNEDMSDADLTVFIREAFQDGVQQALAETSKRRTQNADNDVLEVIDDVFDNLFIKTKRIGNKKMRNKRQRIQTNNEDITVQENDGQLLLDAVKNIEEKIDTAIGGIETANRKRYVRTRNFKQITNADGDVEVIVDAGVVGIIPPDTSKITVSPLKTTTTPLPDVVSEALESAVSESTQTDQDGWEPVSADDLDDLFDDAAAVNTRDTNQNNARSTITNNSESGITLDTILSVADSLRACPPRLPQYFPEVPDGGCDLVSEMI